MRGDGDGWVTCDLGHKHWGRYGAAGLLVRAPGAGGPVVLLQLRVEWSHHGGTWGVPGGARDSDESARATAFREVGEEAAGVPPGLPVAATLRDDHGGWSYTTVLADAAAPFPAAPGNAESDELRWVAPGDLAALPLHPGFAATWPAVRDVARTPAIVVDGANVVGSRPDGWWRDRLGAARRLRDRLAALAGGVPASELPELSGPAGPVGQAGGAGGAGGDLCWFPAVELVVEGAARALAREPGPATVTTTAAPAAGDDAIVAAAAAHRAPGRTVVVVTADRELRHRCTALGPDVVTAGPRRLLDLLPE